MSNEAEHFEAALLRQAIDIIRASKGDLTYEDFEGKLVYGYNTLEGQRDIDAALWHFGDQGYLHTVLVSGGKLRVEGVTPKGNWKYITDSYEHGFPRNA